MRIRLYRILFALVLSIITPAGFVLIHAQDVSFPGTEINDLEVDKETEKMKYAPGELDPAFKKAQTTSPVIRDSAAIKPVVKSGRIQTPDTSKAPVKRPSEEDDSILSFNFLYYVFQKYKMQDIVD